MFRTLRKTALTFLMVLGICLSAFTAASAAGSPGIIVRLGDSEIAVTDIRVSENCRAYAPYDTLFAAMGAEASFDTISQTVTAVSGDTTVQFFLGSDVMTVTAGASSQDVDIDAEPYQDDNTGKIYIPIRYAAQALGYVVGWDGDSKAVTLQSVDSLIAQSGATYTLMDRLLKYQNEFAAKKHAISGNFELNVSMPSADDAAAVPLKVTGAVTGLASQNDAEMSLTMKSNASAFAESQNDGEALDEETMPLLSLLDEFDLKMIINSQTGMIYMQMPLLSAMSGQSPDAWLSMDTSQMTSGVQSDLLSGQFTDVTSFRDYVNSALKGICLYDNGINASDINEMLAMLNSMFSDQAFVREGDNYVSVISPEDLGAEDSELVGSLKITLKFKGDAYAGMALDASFELNDTGSVLMNITSDAAGSSSVSMSMNMPSALTMELKAAFTTVETDKAPASEPPAGSTVIPLDELIPVASGFME